MDYKLDQQESVGKGERLNNIVSFAKFCNYKVVTQEIMHYEEAKTQLRLISIDADKIIKIVEEESSEYDRRLAFLETTYKEICSGADYSKCETIQDISKVFASSLINRLLNLDFKTGGKQNV